MADKPDLAALKKAAEESEAEYFAANAAKVQAIRTAKEKWTTAAAAHARYTRAKERMERTQMRARGVVETGGNEPA